MLQLHDSLLSNMIPRYSCSLTLLAVSDFIKSGAGGLNFPKANEHLFSFTDVKI